MNFKFAFAVNLGSNLNHRGIGTAFSVIADEVTGGDRLSWGVWARGTEVGIDFDCQCCRDRFAAIVADTMVDPV